MADAAYRIKVKRDINGTPLLVVSLHVEYEVVLDSDRFTELHRSAARYADGVEGQKLTQEEFRLWEEELRRMGQFRNSLGELPSYALEALETKPCRLPRGLVHQILTDFENNTSKSVNIFATGQYPEFALSFNWGAVSYSIPLSASEITANLELLSRIGREAQKCIDDGKPTEDILRTVGEVIATVHETAGTTSDVIECAGAVALACRNPMAIPLVFLTCGDVVQDIKAMIEAAETAKREKEKAEREKQQRIMEDSIDRMSRCREVRNTGIERARDLERAIIHSRSV